MGNEQSSSTGPTSSSSTFSFLSNRASRKGKGIVVVNDGNGKAISVEDDEMYKRYKDIPKFLPIIRSTIGKKDIFLDQTQKLQSRPIYKFATRLQEHLHLCAREVQQDQNKLIAMAKKTENSATQYGATIAAKRGSYNSFLCSMKHIHEIDHEIGRIQVILEEIVPTVEHINSLLSTDDQLAPLNLRSILTRTPPMSSTDSSAISTPRHHMNAIEEIRVVDQN